MRAFTGTGLNQIETMRQIVNGPETVTLEDLARQHLGAEAPGSPVDLYRDVFGVPPELVELADWFAARMPSGWLSSLVSAIPQGADVSLFGDHVALWLLEDDFSPAQGWRSPAFVRAYATLYRQSIGGDPVADADWDAARVLSERAATALTSGEIDPLAPALARVLATHREPGGFSRMVEVAIGAGYGGPGIRPADDLAGVTSNVAQRVRRLLHAGFPEVQALPSYCARMAGAAYRSGMPMRTARRVLTHRAEDGMLYYREINGLADLSVGEGLDPVLETMSGRPACRHHATVGEYEAPHLRGAVLVDISPPTESCVACATVGGGWLMMPVVGQ